MNDTIKIDGQNRAVNPLTVHETDRPVYTASGLRVPSEEVRARRLAREAEAWLALAVERTRMRPHTLVRKALDGLSFSASKRAQSFAVPTKLVGVGAHQRALWGLVRGCVEPWSELALTAEDGELVARYEGERLGRLQGKHDGWVRPLLPFGLTLHLARVTGTDYDGYTLGCNVVLGSVGVAVGRLRDALGADAPAPVAGHLGYASGTGALPGGGPSSGDGAAGLSPVVATAPDRATDGLPEVRVLPESAAIAPGASPDDVVLWRDAGAAPHASVPHARRHSEALDWGRVGAGPADLARSVLLALTDEATAEALYGAFADEVVARVPEAGGTLRAAEVRAWCHARRDAHRQGTPTA